MVLPLGRDYRRGARTRLILLHPHPGPVMNTPGAKAYRPWTPELYAHQAHAPSAKLPEDDLVFFLIDVVPKLDLSKIHAPYQDETRGAPPFDPSEFRVFGIAVNSHATSRIGRLSNHNIEQ